MGRNEGSWKHEGFVRFGVGMAGVKIGCWYMGLAWFLP